MAADGVQPGRRKVFLALLLGFGAGADRFPLHVESRGARSFSFRHRDGVSAQSGFLLVFVPFFAPILAVVSARWMRGYDARKDRFVLNGALMAIVVAGIVRYFRREQNSRNSFPTTGR